MKRSNPKKTITTPEVAPQTPPGAVPAPGQSKPQGPGLTTVPTARFAPSTLAKGRQNQLSSVRNIKGAG